MVSCGAATLRQFNDGARLTLVSDQSFQEAHASIDIRATRTNLN
jgi:IMP dehydrogenase